MKMNKRILKIKFLGSEATKIWLFAWEISNFIWL